MANRDDETDNEKELALLVPEFSVIKLIFCVSKQRGWHAKHFGARNEFFDKEFEWLVFLELPRDIDNNNDRRNDVINLKRSLCGLKKAARNSYELVKDSCEKTVHGNYHVDYACLLTKK